MTAGICRGCCRIDQVVTISTPCADTQATIFGQPVVFAAPGESARFTFSYCNRCRIMLGLPQRAPTASECASVVESVGNVTPIHTARTMRGVNRGGGQ